MKFLKLVLAFALLAVAAPSSPQTAPAPWLVAQIASCEVDGRKVPTEAYYCREGRLWVCTTNGTWTNTNKPC